MNLKELYDTGTSILDESGIENPGTDAFYLLEHITGIDMSGYLMKKGEEQSRETQMAYMSLIETRAAHVPYQYITGETSFMGYTIKVTPDVLIPRFDTEVLCDEASRLCSGSCRVLDMCTGSGCIAVALSCMCRDAIVTACDISEAALQVARENARINGARIEFIRGDLFEKLEGREYELIVSNPPYVTESEYRTLSPEVRDHEPAGALLAGDDGLDIYRRLIPEAMGHLACGGHLMMETGCTQGAEVKALMEQAGFVDISIIKDLAGLDRVIKGKKPV